MSIESYLAEKRELVEAALQGFLADDSIPSMLARAMKYSLSAGGKRLRPILVGAGAEAVGGSFESVMPIGCALEMIHTFSLIHDDLPAMDDDDLRRGKPTSHKVFGEATAILAGDGLLAEAFSVMTRAVGNPPLLLEVMRDVADATGPRGMTGGQQLDMEAVGQKFTEDKLAKLHNLKTGRLIAVSVVSGAKFCGATSGQLAALRRYGEAVGLAFQIADDILDIEGSREELGKDIGSDVANDKATYPAIIGLEASRAKAKNLVQDALKALSTFDTKADPLREIARYIVNRRN